MQKLKTHLIVAVCLLAFGSLENVLAYSAVQNKADNLEVRIVPAPKKVVIDGDLSDWDRSGEIFMFIDEKSRDKFHVRLSMMFDDEYLYVGGHWADPTPMRNMISFGGDVLQSWNADALQMRFLSDPAIRSEALATTGAKMSDEDQRRINNITLWYSTADQAAGYLSHFTIKGTNDKVLNPEGVEGAFVKDKDGSGATFEYRIPWSVLRAPRPLKAGDAVQMQFQVHWGNDKGTKLKAGITDVRNPNSNALGYMGPGAWGIGRFMSTGNLPPSDRGVIERAPGHIPIKFKLERDAKVSINIKNEEGRSVRTGIGARPYPAGQHEWLWDGLDDNEKPLPVGKYSAEIMTHDGVGQKYVTNVGMSGSPTWQTEDGTGGWAGDYRYPSYVATQDDFVILGTGSAEAAPYTIRTDLEGEKKWGSMAEGHTLALHGGFGYMISFRSGKMKKFDLATGRLSPFANGSPEVEIPAAKARASSNPRTWKPFLGVSGFVALDDQRLLLGVDEDNKLFLLDMASGEVKKEVELNAPGGLAVDAKGHLLAVSGNSVGRMDLEKGVFTPIINSLDSPTMLACDSEGNVYVSLRGSTMQVWKLSPTGEVLMKYGKLGGRPALGAFDPAGMLEPSAIAVDKNNRLWVCERDGFPKRYSVWNPDGTLWRDFYGSHDYSTGVWVDPDKPEHVYANNVRYVVDYETGDWRVGSTILRSREEGGITLPQSAKHAGARYVTKDGRKFLVTPQQGANFAIYEAIGDQFVPHMFYKWDRRERKGQWWIDTNNDGRVQADEITKREGIAFSRSWSLPIDKDLNIYTYEGDGWGEPRPEGRCTVPYTIYRLDFKGFADNGALQYADQPVALFTDNDGGSVSELAVDPDGSIYALVSGGLVAKGERAQSTGGRVVKFSPSGQKLWEYRNVHVGFAWTSDTYTPGSIVAAFRMHSVDHPDFLPVTGYYGQYFLLDKKTGLFVDALCQDQRSAYTMDHTFVGVENFNGSIWKHPKTGKSYFSGGDADARIWELTGLDSIKHKAIDLQVTSEQADQARVNSEQNQRAQAAIMARNKGRKSATLLRLKNPAVDGGLEKWAATKALQISEDASKPSTVRFGYDDRNLYARFEVKTPIPFKNSPSDHRLLFKSGSALELVLTAHTERREANAHNVHPMEVGDLRVIIARNAAGKMMATRYRPKIEAGTKPNATSFETPSAGRESFDEIIEWNELPMHYEPMDGGYIVEVALPWSEIGIKPGAGMQFLADAGVILGNEGGTRNATRAMWSNQTPEIHVNNDIPTESRLHPNGWGMLLVE